MTIPNLRRLAFSTLCIVSVGLASISRAEDEKIPELKTASGKTYQDVRITKVTPSEISIIHESGVARIPLKDLPDDLKTKFGYDPAKAEAHAVAKAQADAQNEAAAAKAELAARQRALDQKRLKEAKEQTFKIMQVLKKENGVLANFYFPGGAPGAAARSMNSLFGRGSSAVPSRTGEIVFLRGKISPNLVDGAVIVANIVSDGSYEYTNTLGATSTVKKLEVLQHECPVVTKTNSIG
jgi:hypothetical protein